MRKTKTGTGKKKQPAQMTARKLELYAASISEVLEPLKLPTLMDLFVPRGRFSGFPETSNDFLRRFCDCLRIEGIFWDNEPIIGKGRQFRRNRDDEIVKFHCKTFPICGLVPIGSGVLSWVHIEVDSEPEISIVDDERQIATEMRIKMVTASELIRRMKGKESRNLLFGLSYRVEEIARRSHDASVEARDLYMQMRKEYYDRYFSYGL